MQSSGGLRLDEVLQGHLENDDQSPDGRRTLLSRLISFRFLFFFLITRC